MYQYSNSLIRQFPSAVTGNAAVGVQATVYVGETGMLASLFEVNGSPKSNPVTTDGKGFYSFSLADGDYRIVFSSSQFATLRISVLDGAQIREDFDNLAASNEQFKDDQQNNYSAFTASQQAAYDSFVLSQGWDQVGTFAAGFTFSSPNQVGQDSSGNWWRWNGALPKTVTAGTLPSSDANYKLVGDGVLRSDLASPSSNVLIASVEAGGVGNVFRSSLYAVANGLLNDGVTINNSALTALQTLAAGKAITFTGGVYRFSGDITFTVPVIMAGGVLLGEGFVNFDAGVMIGDYHWLQMRLGRYNGKVSAKWYGALGDGSADTPTDTGVDIESAPWNTWDGTLFKTDSTWSPYYSGAVFTPPRDQPFKNTDTWDYIGINMALWFGGSAYVPSGVYKIDLGNSAKATYRGLITMRGMEQTFSGDGRNDTIIEPAESAAFFEANNVGVRNQFPLYTQYRNGGPPSVLKDVWLRGPEGYNSASGNLTLILGRNINGITVQDIWMTAASRGWSLDTSSGDSFLDNVTTEYLFNESVDIDATSELWIRSSNLWSSASIVGQVGVNCDGFVRISNSKLRDFKGASVQGAAAVIDNCEMTSTTGPSSVIDVDNLQMTGGRIDAGSTGALIRCKSGSQIGGNCKIQQTSNQPCLNLGSGTAGSATNIRISDVTFIKTNVASEPQNVAITAVQEGVDFVGAATASVFITGNSFIGPASTTVGAATVKNNFIDGTYIA